MGQLSTYAGKCNNSRYFGGEVLQMGPMYRDKVGSIPTTCTIKVDIGTILIWSPSLKDDRQVGAKPTFLRNKFLTIS